MAVTDTEPRYQFLDPNTNALLASVYLDTTANSLVHTFDSGVDGVRSYNDGSMDLPEQDLSMLSLTASENGRIYRHDGANSINADGGTTSSPGYYAWDNSASEFKSIVQF